MALTTFACSGIGLSLLKIAGVNLLQRVARAGVAGRIFGVLEALQMGAMAIGSIAISTLTETFGLRVTLVSAGLAVPLCLAILAPRLFAMDGTAVPADAHVVRQLRADPIFAPLSATSLERLALSTQQIRAHAGELLTTEGDPGETYCLILSGAVAISKQGQHLRNLAPGDSFGEIALLRDVSPWSTAGATARPAARADGGHATSKAWGKPWPSS